MEKGEKREESVEKKRQNIGKLKRDIERKKNTKRNRVMRRYSQAEKCKNR